MVSLEQHPATFTDLLALPLDALTEDGDGWIAVHCPTLRGYWGGNFLFLDPPPRVDQLEETIATWRSQFHGITGIQKKTLVWEVPAISEHDTEAWTTAAAHAGLEFDVDDVLRVDAHGGLMPKRSAPPFVARPVVSETDWSVSTELLVIELGGPTGTEDYVRKRQAHHRSRMEAGHGTWWTMWDGSEAVGTLGLISGPGYARFQQVVTRSDCRGRGVCSHLMAAAAGAAPADSVRNTLICVEPESGASSVYRGLGFEPIGVQIALMGDPV
ncbi:MAG: GNAT family N-acetyltransferase [Planctomycetota bacterium]